MPLPESLLQIGNKLVDYFDASGGEAPYILYVYPPAEEFVIRRELGELCMWLKAKEVACLPVSLADLFWQALEEQGWLDSVIQEERRASNDPSGLERVYESVGEVLRESPTLPERVIAELDGSGDRTAAFLYRAGALYPAYRTSGLLDNLRSRINLPVILLYPGRLVGSFGLRFMDKCEPAYGYRAMIIARGGQE